MRNSFRGCVGWAVVCLCLAGAGLASAAGEPLLARIDLLRPVTELSLPVHAYLRDAAGQDYVLVVAGREELDQAGWPYLVLDAGAEPEDYITARSHRAVDAAAIASIGKVVHDDGRRLIIRATSKEAEQLAAQGFEIRRLSGKPLAWSEPAPAVRDTALLARLSSSLVSNMMNDVQATNLHNYVSQLSGGAGAVIGGDLYAVATRHTAQQVPSHRAAEYVLQHLQALGWQAGYQHWSGGGYSNCNVIAVLPGGTRSNEIVIGIAHLDDAPSGAVAPGADDNASGVAGLLAAAGALVKCSYERTICLVVCTGEEQGGYGSLAYADLAATRGDNITAVLNLDMIAWDGSGGPTLRLHTRTAGNPGYAGDRAIAAMFTNVVASYMAGRLTPIITADGEDASDHDSFWLEGYSAILAIEDDYDDFNPYYHSTGDTLARLNMTYFTWFVRASVGTLAHLASPVQRIAFDTIQVDNSDWTPGSGISVGTFYLRHEPSATESGADGRDVPWLTAYANPNAKRLKIHTQPYGVPLQTDARPVNSKTVFAGILSAVNSNASPFVTSSRLRFSYLARPEADRLYTVRLHVAGKYLSPSTDYDCTTNLGQVIAGGGYVVLPNLVGLTNGAVYGTCEILSQSTADLSVDWGYPGTVGVPGDFDGDLASDLAIFDPVTGNWFVRNMAGDVILFAYNWGFGGVSPVSESFDGDVRTDLAVYHPPQGTWYRRQPVSGATAITNWGYPGAIPIPGNYDAGAADDLAVYDLTSGRWYIKSTPAGAQIAWATNWGFSGAVPVPGDYDADGVSDLAVYSAASGNWYIRKLTGEQLAFGVNWGFPGTVAVPGDYDGDGRSDLAVYDTAKGNWYIRTLDGTVIALGVNWGFSGCQPVAGDYNGDGVNDLAVYHAAGGRWYIRDLSGQVLTNGISGW